jgi:hypothetical protein
MSKFWLEEKAKDKFRTLGNGNVKPVVGAGDMNLGALTHVC